MATTICLLTCALSLGQPDGRSEWQLVPQLFQGLELVYSGTYTEEALIPGVQFQKTYRLEATVFVQDVRQDGWDVVFLTSLSFRPHPAEKMRDGPEAMPSSVRLELAQVNKRGRLKGKVPLVIPLAGPPTLETGAILEMPLAPIRRDQAWFVAEEDRPPEAWQLVGTEPCGGTTCIKLQGEQKSDDWDQPRADHTAWRRRDTVWLGPQLGIAYRVERVIERRDPARRDPTQRLVVRYELDSRLKYPGKLLDDRQNEIAKAFKFREDAAPLWDQPAQYRPHIDALLQKIAFYLKDSPPTPYRKAIVQLQGRLDKARRGELLSEQTVEERIQAGPGIHVGQRAPDFVVTDLITKQSVRFHRSLGRPTLIVFYNPATETGKQVLLYCQGLYDRYRSSVAILAMAATEDAALVRRQHAELKLPFSILDGRGLHLTFGVDATPRIILLDGDGFVRAAYTGWGYQIPREIDAEAQQWLPKQSP